MSRLRWLAAAAALTTCTTSFPGDVVVGAFDFVTSPLSNTCPLYGGDDAGTDGGTGMPSSFTGTVSYDSRTGNAYLTTAAGSLSGTLSGDVLDLSGQAQREIPAATCEGSLSEQLTARMIGEEEALAAGGVCPAPLAADGGAAAGTSDAGTSVVIICGRITDKLAGPDGGGGDGCAFTPCAMEFSLTGTRQQ